MEWIKVLEIPALMVAGLCIWALYQLLIKREDTQARLALEMSENTKIIARLAALLDIVCSRIIGGGPQK